MKKHVVVQSYDKTWADDFVAIRDELNTVLKELVIRIEHVGSTSVEGLSAKPIIDIDVVIQDMKCSFKRELLTNIWDPIGSPIQMLGIINILQIDLIMQ